MEGGNPPPRNRPQPLANDPFDEDEIAKRANDEVPRQRTASVGHGFQVQGSVADFDPGTLKTGSVSGNFALPMSWRKLNYSAGELRILCGLTGTALPGRCLAILGSSGAGKTTFLNAICDRLAEDRHLKLSGRRQLGDVEYERHYRKAMGFVAQDDIVSSLSTPYDALWFSLRTRRGTDRAETEARVQEALEVLRLQHCRDTKIGIPGLEAGLSGGERKRCNIGVELIVAPKILLVDEPTSCLGSVLSAKVVRPLPQLWRMGRVLLRDRRRFPWWVRGGALRCAGAAPPLRFAACRLFACVRRLRSALAPAFAWRGRSRRTGVGSASTRPPVCPA
ncbi:putative ABC transporter [Leptomonas pyrrhocoris]|uniref:Putative ABC transporter n=1 Tax=Leptomonas pyrrhocoris TaxID=157538 RepID=A0A0M9G6J1_LEPPY|nr:putative ABC transporter [Leptomonas pyrrhocoris]XP_015662000.1 putative ABC transporter [Leptomonas pyrrhocoris]XP_015662001.1 putative ABC transporter [Leptomonas pyrrhocoris]XP_015662002.1 putative ABC transporter [Leptomonas pyrrhocoris]XP_015662003.1 putative ABC transporter [Leptomonas pyrrhocoris]XP_015662004.1 putative ABC transporter [Leptomonas pyrrhocoris]KPA83560.1 putative ABC transporter [Leptomonas pyrrhocoris]KPA83561.1 putative ABC transporter [Leptomonas pyrrhocoris]KPA|eukprot:XP_015661999.1 putative ABC transporter [Leptomonas pyrrhocoris]